MPTRTSTGRRRPIILTDSTRLTFAPPCRHRCDGEKPRTKMIKYE
jgi:hypothetical protein